MYAWRNIQVINLAALYQDTAIGALLYTVPAQLPRRRGAFKQHYQGYNSLVVNPLATVLILILYTPGTVLILTKNPFFSI
jgi:hypothetical protein